MISIANGMMRRVATRFGRGIVDSTRYAQPNLVSISLVGVIGFPLYYVIWRYWFPQPYENLPLRLIGCALFVPLVFEPRWPAALRRWLPAYWFLTLLYALPFFFTFMLLKNGLSAVWGMSTLAAIFLLVLVVFDWLLVTAVFIVGSVLAWAAYFLDAGTLYGPQLYLQQLPIYLFAVVAGSVFNYKTELVKQEKLRSMLSVSRSIAHELRTPLLGIRSGIGGLRQYLPHLIEGYEMARDQGLPVSNLRRAHYTALKPVLDRIEAETDYSNTMIDMLLVNSGRRRVDPAEFTVQPVSDCVRQALDRYPFRSVHERERVRWLSDCDFEFRGSPLLTVHVLFNLLKNALYFVSKAGRGEVTVWAERGPVWNSLHLRDTGTGIKSLVLPHIFEPFYTAMSTDQGAGIGLSFCKMVMESFGGKITCSSTYGEYTEFVLHFPGVSDHGRR